MKRLIVIVNFIFFFPFLSLAQPEDSSPVEKIISVMIKEYEQKVIKGFAEKELEKLVTERYGKKVGEYTIKSISSTLAVINLFESLDDYGKAESESQKYSAALHSAANSITIAIPGVGWISQLYVLSQDIGAAFASRDHYLKMAETLSRISALRHSISEASLAEFRFEDSFIKSLNLRSRAISELIPKSSNLISQSCIRNENYEIISIEQCLTSVFTLNSLLYKQILTLNEIILFKGRFISIENIKSPSELEAIKFSILIANNKFTDIKNLVNAIFSQYAFDEINQLKNSVKKENILRSCQTRVQSLLYEILVDRKKLLTQISNDTFTNIFIKQKAMDLNEIVSGICQPYYSKAPKQIRYLVEEQLMILQ